MSIAIGLGIPSVQETLLRAPDCIYPGAPVYYGHTGGVMIDGTVISEAEDRLLSGNVMPPGGWRWAGKGYQSLNLAIAQALPLQSRVDAIKLIREETTAWVRARFPTFQPRRYQDTIGRIHQLNDTQYPNGLLTTGTHRLFSTT
jgi:hypothetical protein